MLLPPQAGTPSWKLLLGGYETPVWSSGDAFVRHAQERKLLPQVGHRLIAWRARAPFPVWERTFSDSCVWERTAQDSDCIAIEMH